MIGLAIDKFPVDSLRRVLDAPIEQWAKSRFTMTAGRRCLFGHALDSDFDALGGYDNVLPNAFRFDHMWARFGGPRTVRACKLRALKALERGSSQEFEGLPRREMRPTTLSSAPKATVQRLRPGRAHAPGTACICDEPQ